MKKFYVEAEAIIICLATEDIMSLSDGKIDVQDIGDGYSDGDTLSKLWS
ncbi:MAG: hypothetical protein IKJ00_03200 [Clostridia bacterium]|nr:hypothetical protein [Clostridia bacterium]